MAEAPGSSNCLGDEREAHPGAEAARGLLPDWRTKLET
jgi:hypothetical protein